MPRSRPRGSNLRIQNLGNDGAHSAHAREVVEKQIADAHTSELSQVVEAVSLKVTSINQSIDHFDDSI